MAKRTLKETIGENAKVTAVNAAIEKARSSIASLEAEYRGREKQFAATKDKMSSEITKAWAVLELDAKEEVSALEDQAKASLDAVGKEFAKREKQLEKTVSEAKRQVTLRMKKAESELSSQLNELKKHEGSVEKIGSSMKDLYHTIASLLPASSKVRVLSDDDLNAQVDKSLAQIFGSLIEKSGFELVAASKKSQEEISNLVPAAEAAIAKDKALLAKERAKEEAKVQASFDAERVNQEKSVEERKKQISLMQKEYEKYIESETRTLSSLKAKLEKEVSLIEAKIEKLEQKKAKYVASE